ncbi:unnamed protein product, partial [Allacma fusca]
EKLSKPIYEAFAMNLQISVGLVSAFLLEIAQFVFCQQFQMEVAQFILLHFMQHVGYNLENIFNNYLGTQSSSNGFETNRKWVADENKLLVAITQYFKWAKFWIRSLNVFGSLLLVVFASHIVTASLSGFTWLTSSYDLSPLHTFAIYRLIQVITAMMKIFSLANAAQDLDTSVTAIT